MAGRRAHQAPQLVRARDPVGLALAIDAAEPSVAVALPSVVGALEAELHLAAQRELARFVRLLDDGAVRRVVAVFVELPLEQLASDALHERAVPRLLELAHLRDRLSAIAARHDAAPQDVEAGPRLGADGDFLVAERRPRRGWLGGSGGVSRCRDAGGRRGLRRELRAGLAPARGEDLGELLLHRSAEVELIRELDAQPPAELG